MGNIMGTLILIKHKSHDKSDDANTFYLSYLNSFIIVGTKIFGRNDRTVNILLREFKDQKEAYDMFQKLFDTISEGKTCFDFYPPHNEVD